MHYDIESKLNTVKTQIDLAAMTETEKNTMWQKIETGMNKKASFAFGAIRTRVRAAIAFALVAIFASSSVAFAYADSARPGDVLFPLGVAREKVEIFLAPESKKNDLRVKFAEKRIEDGQVFLSLIVKAKGAYAVSYASTTGATTTAVTTTASATATTTGNTATEDATRRFNATISYLQNLQAELLRNGDRLASGALQNAIDAMIAQAHEVPADKSSVLVKVNDNANKFKLNVRIANSTSTTQIAIATKNNNGNGKKDDDNESGATVTTTKTTFFSKFIHKKEEKKQEKEDKHENRDNEDDDDEDEGDNHGSFFDRFGKKATVCHISGEHKKTLSIGKSAVQAHLRHGDTLGKCGDNGTATTTPDTTAPAISSIFSHPATSTVNIEWNTNENASYKFWYDTVSPLALGTPNQTGGANTHQAVNLSGLSADTTYYYVIAATDAAGNTSTSSQQSFKTTAPADITAPVISSIATTDIAPGAATVLWNTNENASYKFWYATTSPLALGSTPNRTGGANTHQTVVLSSLDADTMYYYVIVATDASGNTSTSTERSFKTLVAPDTTAPTLSSIAATAVTSSSATISWTTNENATGKVRYGTALPLTNVLENTAHSLNHAFNLTGLTASTTYRYTVSSTDASGNTALSSELTFTTD